VKPDVVHTHAARPASSPLGGAAREGAGDRSTIHGLAFTASTSPIVNSAYKLLERKTAPITAESFCVADAMREQVDRRELGPRSNTSRLQRHGGVAVLTRRCRAAKRAEHRRADEHIAVGTIARLFHLKGHDDLSSSRRPVPPVSEFPASSGSATGLLRETFEKRIARDGAQRSLHPTASLPPGRSRSWPRRLDLLVPHPAARDSPAAIVQGRSPANPRSLRHRRQSRRTDRRPDGFHRSAVR